MIIPVVITVYSDRSFSFILKTPPASVLLKKAAGLATSKKPGCGLEGAEQEQGRQGHHGAGHGARRSRRCSDMNCTDIEAAMRTVEGTARSMGIDIVDCRGEGRREPPSRRDDEVAIRDPNSVSARPPIPSPSSSASRPRWEARTEPSKEDNAEGRRRIARRSTSSSTARGSTRVEEACALVKKAKFAKFDETVDLAVRLGVNPKHADQMVRGAIVLPHGTGQTVRVLVFAKGEKEREAREAGADFAGSDDMVAKVSEGFMDFDRVIATPDMMGAVGKLGRVLGPRGLMPNPKVGTVTFDVGNAVREAKGGKIEYRVEKAGIVHARIGKVSFNEQGPRRQRERAHQRARPAEALDGQGHLPPEHHASARPWAPACKIDPAQFMGKTEEA